MHIIVMDVTGRTYKTQEVHFDDLIADTPEDITYDEFKDAVMATVDDTKNFAKSPQVTMTIDRDETTFNTANIIWVRVFGVNAVLAAARFHFEEK